VALPASRNNDLRPRNRAPWWVGYAVTTILEFALTALLLLIEPYFPLAQYPISYVVLLMVIGFVYGAGPAVLALVLGLAAFDYFFVYPPYAFWPIATTPRGWTAFAAFFIGSAAVWIATVLMNRAQRRTRRLAEDLRDANERTTGILSSITDASFALDLDWRFTYVNVEAERLLRKTRQELIGNRVWDIFPEAVGSTFQREYERAVAEQITVEVVDFYPPLETWFEVRAYPSPEGLSIYFRDVTERRRAQERQELTASILDELNRRVDFGDSVREILRLVKTFVGVEAVAIRLRAGEDFPYFVADGFPEEFLRTENSLLATDEAGNVTLDEEGRAILECMCGNIALGRSDPFQPFFTQGGSFWTNSTSELLATTSEEDRLTRTRNRCNTEGYESVALVPLRMNHVILGLLQLNDKRTGRFTLNLIECLEDVGASIGIALARKQAEDALAASEQRYRDLAEVSPVGIFRTDARGDCLYVNERWCEMAGISADEALGEGWVRGLHPEDRDRVAAEWYQAAQERRLFRSEYRFCTPQGRTTWVLGHAMAKLDECGEVAGYVGTITDITERKEAEREASIREEIAAVLLTVPDDEMYGAVLQVILRATESRFGVCGYMDEEGALVAPSMTRDIWDQCAIPGKSYRFPRETWGDSIWGRAVTEKRSLRKNTTGDVPEGHLPIENAVAVPILFRDEAIGYLVVANKKGGYTEADQAWLEGTARFIAPVLSARLERKIIEEALRESEEHFRLLHETMLQGVVHQDAEGKIISANPAAERILGQTLAELRGQTSVDLQDRCVREDGTPFPGVEHPAMVTLRTGQEVKGVVMGIHNPRENSRHWISIAAVPLFGSGEDKPYGVHTLFDDITDVVELQRTLQHNLTLLQSALAVANPEIGPGYAVAARYVPAFAGQEIGGDFYDVFRTEDGGMAVLIGDVSGKGIPAAALAATTRSTIRAFAYELSSTDKALAHTNAVLHSSESETGNFVTAILMILDPSTGAAQYSIAGHPPAALRRADGSVEFLAGGDAPIGIGKGLVFTAGAFLLNPGDKVVLYTDGITEARRCGELFDLEGVESSVRRHGHGSAQDLAAAIIADAREWAEGRIQDDVALVVIERLPS